MTVKDNLIKMPVEDKNYYLIQMTYVDDKSGKETTGNIRVINNKFVFEGDAEESAKVFFEHNLKKLVDDYLKVRAEYTEKPYIKKMKENCFSGDTVCDHENADDILFKLLKQLGYKKLAKLFECVDKWYA